MLTYLIIVVDFLDILIKTLAVSRHLVFWLPGTVIGIRHRKKTPQKLTERKGET